LFDRKRNSDSHRLKVTVPQARETFYIRLDKKANCPTYSKYKENFMVTVKESVEQIKERFIDLFGSDVTDIRLEEIYEDSKSNEYYLTLSFLIPNNNIPQTMTSSLGNISFPYVRQYKKVIVNKTDGNINSIMMYNA